MKKSTLVLILLQDGEQRYGLDLVKKSNGHLKRGTIYVTLDRMEESGLITSKKKATPKGSQGPPRRVYRITGKGGRVLSEELSKQDSIAKDFGIGGVS